jgi:hypothetical protein
MDKFVRGYRKKNRENEASLSEDRLVQVRKQHT